jgi:hypothetical protein
MIMDKGMNIMEGNPKELLSENIEPYVLELIDKSAAERIETKVPASQWRKEESGERIIYFGKEYKQLREMVSDIDPQYYYLRQINLEDLFLQATGRRLNEKQ